MMNTRNRIKTVLTLATLAMAILATSAQAATTTITGTAGGTDSWNTAANWDNGVPSGAVDAIVSDGVLAQVQNAATPTYSGTLTLNSNSAVRILNAGGSQNAVQSPSGIIMNEGSKIQVNINANINFPPITLAGNASLESLFGASDHQTDNFAAITGAYTLTISGFNNHTYNLNAANSFTELIGNAIDRYNIRGKAAGSLGTGDVIINPRSDGRSARLYIDAADAMADTATLYLNGTAGQGGYTGDGIDWVVMNADDTIAGLWIYGVQMPPGTYDNTETWLGGPGTLTVAAPDLTLPEADAGVDMVTWSGQAVQLDPNVVNNDPCDPQAPLTYLWTADPADGVEFSDPTALAPTVTITKATDNPSIVTLTLSVNNVGSGKDDVVDAMTIDVYDDACLAAKAVGLAVIDPTDFDGNCITAFEDFALMATTWLDDYTLTEPVPK